MNNCKKDVLGFPCMREAGHSGFCDPRQNIDVFEFKPTSTRDVLLSPMLIGPLLFGIILILGQFGLDIYLLVR